MKVVIDTSCISAFLCAGRLGFLLEVLKEHELFITEQVLQELKNCKNEKVKDFSHPRIKIASAESAIAEKYGIHIGEASVISFAKEQGAFAIIDDKKARQAAIGEKVEFAGTAALIKNGLKKEIINKKEAEEIISGLCENGRLYLSNEIRELVCE